MKKLGVVLAAAFTLALGVVLAPAANATAQLTSSAATRCDANGVCVRLNVWLESPTTASDARRRTTIQVFCYRGGGTVVACRSITRIFLQVREKQDGASSFYSLGSVDTAICTSGCPVSHNQGSTPFYNMVTTPPAPADRQDQAYTTATVCPSTGNQCFNIQDGLVANTPYYAYPG